MKETEGGVKPIIRPEARITIMSDGKRSKKKSQSITQGKEESQKPLLTHNNTNDGLGGRVPARCRQELATRYATAAKTLLPLRPTPKDGHEMPLERVGFCNYLFIGWLSSLMYKAVRSGLSVADVPNLSERDQARTNAERLQRLWEEEVSKENKENISFAKVVWRFISTRFIIASALMIVASFFQFLGPTVLLKKLLEFLELPENTSSAWGWTLVAALFGVQMTRNLTFSLNFCVGIHTSMRLMGAAQYLAFSKMLRLGAPNEAALGLLMTFVTGDQLRMAEAVSACTLFFATPIMFSLSIAYCYYLIGPYSLIGMLAILCFYPIMGGVAALTSVLRHRAVFFTDGRVAKMNELVNAMRLIKMYAWEDPFEKRILELRAKETKQLRTAAFIQSLSASISPSVSIVATVATFMAMTLTGVDLSAPTAFAVFSLFSSLQFTIGTLPYSLKSLAESKVAFRRIQLFLMLPEHQQMINSVDEMDSHLVVKASDACLAWTVVNDDKNSTDEDENKDENKEKNKEKNGSKQEQERLMTNSVDFKPCLFNINFEVHKGSLVGVAGPVGGGKSSLLAAIVGEMRLQSGKMAVRGRLALVSQQAWLFNASLRENILFGAVYDKRRYNAVIDACELESDLKALSNGDMTEIGERGVNLSGGQKQRVNLARALYADLDVYLLDDPLSAVDARVGKDIFEKYVKGDLLANKTIILVTHAVHFLERCDTVLFVKDGRILEQGAHAELMSNQHGAYAHMVSFDETRRHHGDDNCNLNHVDNDEQDEEENDNKEEMPDDIIDDTSPVQKAAFKKQKSVVSDTDTTDDRVMDYEESKMTKDEEINTKQAGWPVLKHYFKASGGYCVIALLFLSVLTFCLVRVFTSVWLQIWLDAGDGQESLRIANATMVMDEHALKGSITDNPELHTYQLVFCLMLVAMLAIGIPKGFFAAHQLLKGSSCMHDAMLKAVIRSPMAFFDVTPAGRILNRFSKDMDEMDVKLPYLTEVVSQTVFICLTQSLLICFVYPWFTPLFVALVALFLFLDAMMNAGVVETKKVENVNKSNVLQHLSSAMAGVVIIRSFGRQAVFQKRFHKDLNKQVSAQTLFIYASRWFSVRLELLTAVTIALASAFAVAFRGSVSAAVAGLGLSNLFFTAIFVTFVMRLKAEYRANFNAVERVAEFANTLESEASVSLDSDASLTSWPVRGSIAFSSVCFRYRPELPLVLNNLCLSIEGGQKVGIVGRTGAGKTSLVATLLRLAELESGRIDIDDVDISQLGLAKLRKAIAVIPQDPVLFQGSLRYNLDPFDEHSDENVWRALEKAHLKSRIADAGNEGLSMRVELDGDNFSVGEKQLICLARALLRNNHILLLDEATASVDVKTDYLIQSTLSEAFSDCTVLTVAHRLHTVMQYDKIIVMKDGEVVEFDAPAALIVRPEGHFASMLKAANFSDEQIKRFLEKSKQQGNNHL